MNLLINKKVIIVFLISLSRFLYSGNKDSWTPKPTYDIVHDSLSKYDLVNIFYKNQISIDLNKQFETTYTIHQKTKIFTKKGLDIHPEFLLPNIKLIEKIKARSIKPNGSYTDLKREDIKITPLEFGSGVCKFVVPATEIGDEIEFLISYSEKGNVSIPDIFFHREAFTLLSEFTVIPSREIKIETKGYNNLPNAKTEFIKDKKHYTWNFINLDKIGKSNKPIVYNDLPFLRIAVRSVYYKNRVTIPVEYEYWSDYRKDIVFDEYVGHRLSYDKNLGNFITKHLGAETDNLSKKQRFDNLAKVIGFINDSLTLFYPKDTTQANKLLGDHLKEYRLPYSSIMDLYTVLLDMTYFDYNLCLGRSRELGNIDDHFVSRNQITEIFFSFEFEEKTWFIFPKGKYESYDFGEIPQNLESTKAISFPRKGTASNTSVLILPATLKLNNTKSLNTFSYIKLMHSDDKFLERSKLITTGAFTSVYRNLFQNLQMDSVDIDDINKIIFNGSEDQIDSLSVEKSEHIPPFVFSIKFNKSQNNIITNLNDSLKTVSLSNIIIHKLADAYSEENDEIILPVTFSFIDNIKYYLLFDKNVKVFHSENEDILFENDFGTYQLKITQINPTTVYVFSKFIINKSNLNLSNHSSLHELCKKVKAIKNTNLSFKVVN